MISPVALVKVTRLAPIPVIETILHVLAGVAVDHVQEDG